MGRYFESMNTVPPATNFAKSILFMILSTIFNIHLIYPTFCSFKRKPYVLLRMYPAYKVKELGQMYCADMIMTAIISCSLLVHPNDDQLALPQTWTQP